MDHTVLLDSTQAGGVCPNPECGRPLTGDECYCIYCGAEIAPAFGSDEGGGHPSYANTCYRCGTPYQSGESFCTQCGADLRGGWRPDTPPIPEPPGPVPPPPAPSKDCCPVCGVPLRPDDTRCPVCDARIDDDELVRTTLLSLTRAEARQGCRKTFELDGRRVTVDVPPGTSVYTHVDIEGLGYEDERTGRRGPLRVCFHPK